MSGPVAINRIEFSFVSVIATSYSEMPNLCSIEVGWVCVTVDICGDGEDER